LAKKEFSDFLLNLTLNVRRKGTTASAGRLRADARLGEVGSSDIYLNPREVTEWKRIASSAKPKGK
jgi:hypothetical protein